MSRTIEINQDSAYIVFPIQAGAEKKAITILQGEKIVTEFNVPIGDLGQEEYQYDFLAKLPVSLFEKGKVTLKGSFCDDFLELVFVEECLQLTNVRDLKCDKKLVSRREEAQDSGYHVHFSPEYGWINDPNGLVYKDGLYHLYFQYNPFDIAWDNMSWGHAVSRDLMNWKQKDLVMLPDEDGMIFSGCGLVNEKSLLQLPKDALLFYYSAAGSSNAISEGKEFVQKLAYSLDGGEHLHKSERIILQTICKENRDPKIFWHEDTNAYIMCIWLEGFEFAILRSTDLENWKISQRFTLNQGFECPDLFPLQTKEGILKWVFWCADGYYFLGEFDGFRFETDGIRKEAYASKVPYAAQTISNVTNRRISVPWLRTKCFESRYTGLMGIPREFSLIHKGEDLFLGQSIVEEVKEAFSLVIESGLCQKFHYQQSENRAMRITCTSMDFISSFEASIYKTTLQYEQSTGILEICGEKIMIGSNINDFSVIYDRGLLEISADSDIIYAVIESGSRTECGDICIHAEEPMEVNVYLTK